MSLRPASDSSVPDDTAAVARATFPQETACLRPRDRLSYILAGEQFVILFPNSGQRAGCPWRLALVTLLQFGEALLSVVTGPGAPAWLREVPAVEILRRIECRTFAGWTTMQPIGARQAPSSTLAHRSGGLYTDWPQRGFAP